MRKSALILLLLLLPTLGLAQGSVTVSAVYGPIEWKPATAAKFVALQPSTQVVHVGDQIRTLPGGTLTLVLPDSSYMVITENSTVTVQDFWATDYRSLVNVLVGKVRFYIQRIGGKPNPYRVQTPTALIAVRGTTFEVTSYGPKLTEVSCLEGRVAVETIGVPNREVILEPGMHTMVHPGAPPLTPVALNESLIQNRVIQVTRKNSEDPQNGVDPRALGRIMRDNDRMNRVSDPLQAPRSGTSGDVQRAKPSLKYPN